MYSSRGHFDPGGDKRTSYYNADIIIMEMLYLNHMHRFISQNNLEGNTWNILNAIENN